MINMGVCQDHEIDAPDVEAEAAGREAGRNGTGRATDDLLEGFISAAAGAGSAERTPASRIGAGFLPPNTLPGTQRLEWPF